MIQKFLISVVLAILVYITFSFQKGKFLIPSFSPSTIHYSSGCIILSDDLEILWQLPNYLMCSFLPDGRLIASNGNVLRFFSPDMYILWEKTMPIHHQLNINGEEILAMTETYHEHKGELVRLDSLVVFNLQGAQIKRFDLGPHSNIWPHYIDKEPWEQPSTVIRNLTTHKELSHFNSFYKIEKNNSPIPAFVEGNYIVNDIFSNRVYILDENLNSVIWGYHFSHEKRGRNRTHDVQVLPSGRLLVYVNGGSDSPYSSLVELDPVTKERFLLFKEEPVEKFYAQRAGGVQKISPSRLLFSDITNGSQFHVVDLTTKKKVRTVTLDGLVPREPQDLQQVKQRDLSLFLKNNKGI